MILADKISELRRSNNLSQEELAEKMDVSRQSVSKWESGNSIPDLNKIIKLSEIFGVSTDYLIKDDMEKDDVIQADNDGGDGKRNVSLETATSYMNVVMETVGKKALGVALCVLAPAVLIGMLGFAEGGAFSEDLGTAIGVGALLILVAIGVLLLISAGMKLSQYEYLSKEPLSLDYGVSGVVQKKKDEFAATYARYIAIGVTLCIVSCVPLVVVGTLDMPDMVILLCVSILLILVACAVYLFVWAGSVNSSYQVLLQENDYTVRNKAIDKRYGWIWGAYWMIAVAIYLAISFLTEKWGSTWIVWPVAGVLCAPVYAAARAFANKKIESTEKQ